MTQTPSTSADLSTTNNDTQRYVDNTETGLRIDPAGFVKGLPFIDYKQTDLHIEDVAVSDLVEAYGTPLYVYSKQAILQSYNAYNDSFASVNGQICYAVKANSNLAVLNILVNAGAGFDIVSVGEMQRALTAGADPSRIVFSGVGKNSADIKAALDANIGCFNVESLSELDTINEVASHLGKRAPISIRVNPDVDAKTHPYISTGLKDNKFGINHDNAVEAYQYANGLSHLNIVGIDCHIGSQLTEIEPFEAALDKIIELINALKQNGITLEHIDLGGGLGVRYIDENVASISEFADALLPKLQALDLKVLFEPGRSIVANAGVLLTTVDVLKPTEHKNFAIVDAAMNDLIRPALYQAEMAVIPATIATTVDDANAITGVREKSWDIVGAVCETGDFLAKGRSLSLSQGDVLAITGAGSYGFVMSSNYNTRPRAAEIMVSAETHQVVRQRETIEQLYALETMLQD